MSEYFRKLFHCYCSLRQYRRGRILFKDTYRKILSAIKNKCKSYVSTRVNARNCFVISPYVFSVVKEETFNYFLCKKNNVCHSYRPSKIKDRLLVDTRLTFTDGEIEQFERMAKYGSQYSYIDDAGRSRSF